MVSGQINVENTPDAEKCKAVGKFELQVLVWTAISEAGVSTPFIGTIKGQAVDAEVYVTQMSAQSGQIRQKAPQK
jgi:hypothetical protein